MLSKLKAIDFTTIYLGFHSPAFDVAGKVRQSSIDLNKVAVFPIIKKKTELINICWAFHEKVTKAKSISDIRTWPKFSG